MTAEERAARTAEADAWCREAFAAALDGRQEGGLALVAVGGYGRGELAPYSDLDVVLVHDAAVDVTPVAERIWYPLWDAGANLDHAVRALPEATRAAAEDVRVALGLLDARHVAGDTSVTLRLRADVLAGWRRNARAVLPRVRDLVRERSARVGELAHAAVPDLKESAGGLRDATVLKALAATWMVDVPHVDLERSRLQLLDVRDVLQTAAGRPTDRVAPELWGPLAEGLGLPGEAQAQRRLREIGRRTAHLTRVTWGRVDRVLAPPGRVAAGRGPSLVPLGPGVAMSGGEVVLARGADPADDPLLVLRAAEAAARTGAALAPSTAARLASRSARLPEPWPVEARNLFVRLLSAGPGLLAVWETLDETGALDLLLPEWRRIWLLPHASPVHRFTVDRHVVETCMEAARLIRRVSRPDLLLVAALLHDIGKGERVDHSVAGERVAAVVAARMGFADADVRTIACLVRWHLLLAETATTRDLDDPATIAAVVGAAGSREELDLLRELTEADARATGPPAWTPWRAGLVDDLTARARAAMTTGSRWAVDEGGPEVDPATLDAVRSDPAYRSVRVVPRDAGDRLEVSAADRVGLLSDVAGALALQKISVRAARAWTRNGVATSWWDLDETGVQQALVAQRLDAVASGSVDVAGRLARRPGGLAPTVLVQHDASAQATVLEVRTDDRLGVGFLVTRALAGLGLSVRSAHLSTFGPQALDVFYVQEPGAGALTDDRAAAAAHAVRAALESPG